MISLSYSKLRLWQECELKFCAQELLDFEPGGFFDTDPMIQLGRLLHDLFNEFYRNHAQVHLFRSGREKLDILANKFRDDWYRLAPGLAFDKDSLIDANFEIGLNAIENFWKIEEGRGFQVPIFLEKPFSLRLENCSIGGRIDRVDQEADGAFTVIDYKISNQCRSQADIDQDKQLTLYALACAQQLVGMIPARVGLYYPLQGKIFYSSRSEAQIVDLLEELTTIANLVEERGNDPTLYSHKPENWKCENCSYIKHCPAHRFKYDQSLPEKDMMLMKTELFEALKKELIPKEAELETLKAEIKDYMFTHKITQLGKCKLSSNTTYDYEVEPAWEILSQSSNPVRFIKKLDLKTIENSLGDFNAAQKKSLKASKTEGKTVLRLSLTESRET
ncbi:MAG: PD-(D/E)XK nuclease family protein [Candidatus Caenarcaniphilales bacterium]|nr:PD-(D/E)XK nuclease family protein [Candidatus Caenarcaniphilales bacterium]